MNFTMSGITWNINGSWCSKFNSLRKLCVLGDLCG